MKIRRGMCRKQRADFSLYQLPLRDVGSPEQVEGSRTCRSRPEVRMLLRMSQVSKAVSSVDGEVPTPVTGMFWAGQRFQTKLKIRDGGSQVAHGLKRKPCSCCFSAEACGVFAQAGRDPQLGRFG